jgi:hypothetical protein
MATYRFMTGTWYSIEVPDEKADLPEYSPELLYSQYFDLDDELPDDVEISEDEVDHIWE